MSSVKHTFYIQGMRCASCALTTEKKLKAHPQVSSAEASFDKCCVEIQGDFDNKEGVEIARDLSTLLAENGYTLTLEKSKVKKEWKHFQIAVPIAVGVMVLFVLLQKAGLVNLISTEGVTYGTAFIIGIVASLSTCMAVVGGLLLSMSSTFAKEGDKIRPQLYFHVGRLVAFFVLGGVIGALGSVFQLSAGGNFVIGMIIGLVMLVLGINLLDTFEFSRKLQIKMPKFISGSALRAEKLNHSLTPLLVGVATFFLPCGFTQAMQIYTLSAGSYITGAMTMLVFALGTLPVLALISFSSVGIKSAKSKSVFFKTVGLVVIGFAVINIASSLAAAGIINPLFNM